MWGVDAAQWLADAVAVETLLFAAIFFVLLGLDDFVVDAMWGWRTIKRHLTVYRRHRRQSLLDFPHPRRRFAILVPAWDEASVIGAMLDTLLARLEGDLTVFVGCYPNDRATVEAVAAVAVRDNRVVLVLGSAPGPTTKAGNLNTLWWALRREEEASGREFDAIVMHDAEDLVHRGELAVFDRLLDRAHIVQLPVLPLIDRGSRWVAGHYADEFADGHARQLVLREALGAGLPLAGTGFAIDRRALGHLAELRAGAPFDAENLTEDYELGLALAEIGAHAIFARVPTCPGGGPVAVRAHFPTSFTTAIAQKSRWMAGIAFAGLDHIGWSGSISELWMRMRDRRASLAMVVLLMGYVAFGAWVIGALIRFARVEPFALPQVPEPLLWATAALACWRLLARAAIVGQVYGWREGLRSIPRTVVANLIAIAAGWRALLRYLRMLRGQRAEWGKTAHIFPQELPAE